MTSAPDIVALARKIYDGCKATQDESPRMVFHQQDLYDLDVLPMADDGTHDIAVTLAVVQRLTDQKLFKPVQDGSGTAWKCRSEDEAKVYRSLNREEELIYSLIDEAGGDGRWSKDIKTRSALHEAVITTIIKKLKTKNMITEMKSVEHPNRKMYIKSNLSPSDRATGGPWYTDGEFDQDFIDMCITIILDFIQKRSFYYSKHYSAIPRKEPKKTVKGKMSAEEARARRDAVLGSDGPEEENMDEKTKRFREHERWLPMPAGYRKYPTLDELTVWIEGNSFFTQTLTGSEVQQLLDVMVFDGTIERLIVGSDVMYRALKKSMLESNFRGSVLAEAPCGRCPVFELCEDGGPVGPSNCEYLNEWLGL